MAEPTVKIVYKHTFSSGSNANKCSYLGSKAAYDTLPDKVYCEHLVRTPESETHIFFCITLLAVK